MPRCLKSKEDECHGHDCIDRVGIPCQFDNLHQAGTEEFTESTNILCPNCEGKMVYSAPWKGGVNKWWCKDCGYEENYRS